MLRHLPASRYDRQPWKNGMGVTDEILLLPEGSSRDDFGLRLSRAEISAEGAFSAFTGAERIITVISGQGLMLDFGNHRAELAPLSPFRFDSGLTPNGLPQGGLVHVFNVMASRARWQLQEPQILRGTGRTTAELNVVFALEEGLQIGEALRLGAEDTALAGAGETLSGHGLWIGLTPVTTS
ncbi:HutD/Ves family protein [Pseudogemmobacter faecipullorum]|uniref:HutD family protein n=1 Tax=Pseudogemmobacter faecipullorum TaxID=2755041 RepID=A0ABS8CNI4_9RHOB|nr:HutD family protein [Pseudogemmobacter faecipullorum]MCB5410939.1 HutD family protein [Pseudogemmobacter faecipullorum]